MQLGCFLEDAQKVSKTTQVEAGDRNGARKIPRGATEYQTGQVKKHYGPSGWMRTLA